MVEQGEFLEWANVHEHLYGSSSRNLELQGKEKGLLFEVDCNGARQIREKVPNAVLIFVMTPTFKELINRIQGRGNMDPEELNRRLRTAKEEIRQVGVFDVLVINDVFEDACKEVQSVLLGERWDPSSTTPLWLKRWNKEIQQLSDEGDL